jgi:chemotaxis protein CheD
VSAALALRRSESDNSGGIQAAGRRFFDAAADAWMVKVFPGEFYVSRDTNEVLVTVLGSCVSACIRDPAIGIGGMNHFMLAHNDSGSWGDSQKSTRFGNFAMEKLINELIKAGCSRERMEIKVFGGGHVTDTSNLVGSDNADFVLSYLRAEGLRCAANDLGGTQPRRIHYYPATGRVIRRLLGSVDKYAVTRDEKEYGSRLKTQDTAGDIELFGE